MWWWSRGQSQRETRRWYTTGRKSLEARKGEETGSPLETPKKAALPTCLFCPETSISLLIFTAVGWYIFAVSSHKICGNLLQCQRKQTLPGANIFSQTLYASSDAWNNHLRPWGQEPLEKPRQYTEEWWAGDGECLQPPRELLPLKCMWCKIMYGGTFCNLWPKKKNPSCTIILSCSQPTSALQSHLVMLSQFSHRLGSCRCAQLCPTLCSPMD